MKADNAIVSRPSSRCMTSSCLNEFCHRTLRSPIGVPEDDQVNYHEKIGRAN